MKQEVDFIKFNPTENMTILVRTQHSHENYGHIASRLMSYDCVHAEQVGFIKEPGDVCADTSLWMAGGEFCGNACMSLAAFTASKKEVAEGLTLTVNIQTSGSDRLVRSRVRREMERYFCRLEMPLPERIEKRERTAECPMSLTVITYEEAVHLVVEVDEVDGVIRKQAEMIACRASAGYDGKLVGVLIYRPQTGELVPLIYVPELGSMIWERGCGSGTASLGAYLAWKKKGSISAVVKQPGGDMNVTCDWKEGSISSIEIEGTVEIVAEGKAFIDPPLPSLA